MVLMLADVTLWKTFYNLTALSFYLVMMTESRNVKASN